ncbi:MAG: hypothetical protein LBU19_07240, partial [Treponema sp.]|nr:hypothetical protein [Treponema sp.]
GIPEKMENAVYAMELENVLPVEVRVYIGVLLEGRVHTKDQFAGGRSKAAPAGAVIRQMYHSPGPAIATVGC